MKILIADDHALFRDGLRYLLTGVKPELIVLEAGSLSDTLSLISQHPDITLVLFDLSMPGADGADALDRALQAAPGLPVLVISANEDPAEMRRTLDSGALGYIPKSESPAVMRQAIELVLAGGIYIPPSLMRIPVTLRDPAKRLTPRQFDVLRYVIDGKSNKDIARSLNLTEATVKAHIAAIFRALDVVSRNQVTRAAQQLGLMPKNE